MVAAPTPVSVRLNRLDVGTGRPIVFLHGWGMGLGIWDRQVADLAGQFRTISVDLRGHGASPKPLGPYDYDTHAADITMLLDDLDLWDVVLVGWSMGGGIAARVAVASQRVARAVLVGAPVRFTACADYPWGDLFRQRRIPRRHRS